MLAHLRRGETFAQLADGFGVGTATAWRYVRETVRLLSARAPKLRCAMGAANRARHAFVVIDGTLIPIDTAQRNLKTGPVGANRIAIADYPTHDHATAVGVPCQIAGTTALAWSLTQRGQ